MAPNEIQQRYGTLCARLGDLVLNKEKIDAQILQIKAEIEALNNLAAQKLAAEKQAPK